MSQRRWEGAPLNKNVRCFETLGKICGMFLVVRWTKKRLQRRSCMVFFFFGFCVTQVGAFHGLKETYF